VPILAGQIARPAILTCAPDKSITAIVAQSAMETVANHLTWATDTRPADALVAEFIDAITITNAAEAIGAGSTITTAVAVALTTIMHIIVATRSGRACIDAFAADLLVAVIADAIAREHTCEAVRTRIAITTAIAVTFITIVQTIGAAARIRPRIR